MFRGSRRTLEVIILDSSFSGCNGSSRDICYVFGPWELLKFRGSVFAVVLVLVCDGSSRDDHVLVVLWSLKDGKRFGIRQCLRQY